jgi:hypothetical protein
LLYLTKIVGIKKGCHAIDHERQICRHSHD